jgi:hypothetical protein
MKNAIATDSALSHEYYIVQVNGRVNSTHRRYQEGLRAGLQLKYKFPDADIKLREVVAEERKKLVLT